MNFGIYQKTMKSFNFSLSLLCRTCLLYDLYPYLSAIGGFNEVKRVSGLIDFISDQRLVNFLTIFSLYNL